MAGWSPREQAMYEQLSRRAEDQRGELLHQLPPAEPGRPVPPELGRMYFGERQEKNAPWKDESGGPPEEREKADGQEEGRGQARPGGNQGGERRDSQWGEAPGGERGTPERQEQEDEPTKAASGAGGEGRHEEGGHKDDAPQRQEQGEDPDRERLLLCLLMLLLWRENADRELIIALAYILLGM